ncbi:Meiotic recombination protein SPO11 [Blattella germanica]|nr:Meiotic recombination protein SPO11 [Blattella germanica]
MSEGINDIKVKFQTALQHINEGINNNGEDLVQEIFNKEAKRDELISSIELMVLELVGAVAEGTPPSVGHHSFGLRRSRHRFSLVVFALATVHRLLITGDTCTRREIYYRDPVFCRSQAHLDAAMNDVCRLLQAPSWQLGVFATSKGLIAGPATLFLSNGQSIDCNASAGGVLVPQDIHLLERVESPAKFVLLLEKDAAFQKLLDENVLERLGPCLLVTGKGYPDVCTRVLVRQFWRFLRVPILALVDADPHGLDIMCVYRFGSKKMSHQRDLTVPAVRWLGVHPSDISRLAMKAQPLSVSDSNKLRHLAARPDIANNRPLLDQVSKEVFSNWGPQVQVLISGGKKAEIEGMSSFSTCYLTDAYIPTKILNGDIL